MRPFVELLRLGLRSKGLLTGLFLEVWGAARAAALDIFELCAEGLVQFQLSIESCESQEVLYGLVCRVDGGGWAGWRGGGGCYDFGLLSGAAGLGTA